MEATCRGSYALGTACGKCARCEQDPARPLVASAESFPSDGGVIVQEPIITWPQRPELIFDL